jgi:glycosyltransferase involved in cell wall biosynthesis
MADDLVSVIMPVYNAQRHVSEAIRSVLDQSHERFELIIIDDASTDDSLKRINDFRDRRIRPIVLTENGGAGKARNEGILMAEGRYIAFIDADDIWMEDKLASQIRFMQKENIAFSYTDYFLMNDVSRISHRVWSPSCVDFKKMRKNNYIGCLTAMYDIRELGKIYMPERRKRQDWALWLDILRNTDKAMGLQIPLAAYRKTYNSLSGKKLTLIGENYRFFREVLGYNPVRSGLCLIQFLLAYSGYKITSVKSID